MGSVKTFNKTVTKLTPYPTRLAGIVNGINPDEAVTVSQLNQVKNGTVDLNLIEMGASGTAAAPVITWDGDTDTGIYRIGANEIGITANGSLVVDISTTGVAVTGAISATTTVTATTGISLGTDLTGLKEVDHVITVATTTTAATVGGALTVKAGTGATSGTGGAVNITGGTAGATAGATGGAVNISGGAQGAGNGITGAVNITTPNATGGAAGNILITPGTSSSTTIAPLTIIGRGALVRKPTPVSIATGGTVTGIQLLSGHLSITGGTGNVTLPDTSAITTAIGATPIGTTFDFSVDANGMTATNVATLVMGANMVMLKQTSAGDSATDQLKTITNTSNVNVGVFRIVFDTATTCTVSRIG